MSLSIQFTPEEEALLEAAGRQATCSKSELVRQGVRELCQRLLQPPTDQSPYERGQDLFGAGHLAAAPTDPIKRQVWEALRVKHRRLG
ncbi:MAG: CopG family transcriptional regulator [Candidatus Competibacteraceae bacterium]